MAYKKGESGNPSGRPKKDKEIGELCRKALEGRAGKNLAVDGLLELAMDEDQPGVVRKGCWEALLGVS